MQFLDWAAASARCCWRSRILHLADAASLELVAYTGRTMRRLPVLFVLTKRRLPARQHLDGALAALRSHGALAAEIELRPLRDAPPGR